MAVLIEEMQRVLCRASPTGWPRLVAHFVLLVVWIGALTIVIVLQIAAMTRRILRAIEITARR